METLGRVGAAGEGERERESEGEWREVRKNNRKN